MPIQQIETDARKLAIAKQQYASGAESINIGGKQYKVHDKTGGITPVVKRMLAITPAPQGQPTMGTVSILGRQLPTTGVTSPVQDTSVQAPPIQGQPIQGSAIQTAPRTLPFTAPVQPQPQMVNVPTEGKTPSQFQQAFEAVMKDSMAKANAPYIQGGSDAMLQLLTTTENLPSMEGWAGATTSQKERMAQLERSGLTNMYEGYATALQNKQSRMADLISTAKGVYEETLTAQEKSKKEELDRKFDLLQLQLRYPAGQSFDFNGETYQGLAPIETDKPDKPSLNKSTDLKIGNEGSFDLSDKQSKYRSSGLECGEGYNTITDGAHVSSSWDSKISLATHKENPKIGNGVVLPLGGVDDNGAPIYGHVETVIDVSTDGNSFTTVSWNLNGNGEKTFQVRYIDELNSKYPDAWGFTDSKLRDKYQKDFDAYNSTPSKSSSKSKSPATTESPTPSISWEDETL